MTTGSKADSAWRTSQTNDDLRITNVLMGDQANAAWSCATVYSSDAQDIEKHFANCLLLAAAPELLEVALEALSSRQTYDDEGIERDWAKRARAAIAKATGGDHGQAA